MPVQNNINKKTEINVARGFYFILIRFILFHFIYIALYAPLFPCKKTLTPVLVFCVFFGV